MRDSEESCDYMKDKVSARDGKQPQRTGGLEEMKKLLI